MQQLCALYGAKNTHTTPYHPQGNGGCEQMNRTLLQLLGTLENDKKSQWPSYLPELIFLYNNTVHSATTHTPSYLLLGWHPRLPLDVALNLTPRDVRFYT